MAKKQNPEDESDANAMRDGAFAALAASLLFAIGAVVLHGAPPLGGAAPASYGTHLFVAAASGLVMFLVGRYLRPGAGRMRSKTRLVESESKLRGLTGRWIRAQENERRSISRDLHDDLGQLVTAVCLDLSRAVGVKDKDKKQEIVERSLKSAQSVLDKVHEISSRVRPRVLDDLGLKDAVDSYISDFEARTGIETEVDLDFDRLDVPTEVSENIYRVIQEALNNVAKYSGSVKASVMLRVSARKVSLIVKDEGKGFRVGMIGEDSLGILGMSERAELMGGTFSIKAEPGLGTEVAVTIPIKAGKGADNG